MLLTDECSDDILTATFVLVVMVIIVITHHGHVADRRMQ